MKKKRLFHPALNLNSIKYGTISLKAADEEKNVHLNASMQWNGFDVIGKDSKYIYGVEWKTLC